MSRPPDALSMAGMVPRPSAFAAEFVPSAPSAPARAQAPPAAPPRRGPPRGQVRYGHHGQPGAATDIYANPAARENARADREVLLSLPHPSLARGVPEWVGQYYAVVPIDTAASPLFGRGGPAGVFYKGVGAGDGAPAALLRVLGAPQAPTSQIIRAVDVWKRVRHPALLTLRELFTTRQFTANQRGGMMPTNEAVFAYEYAMRADTLHNVFLGAPSPEHRYHPLGEATLWAIASQLLSALSAVHAVGLALRDALTTTNILVTGRNRVRVSCVGLSDAFDVDGADHIPSSMQSAAINVDRAVLLLREDLVALGRILLTLAMRANPALVRGGVLIAGAAPAIEALQRSAPYSGEFVQLVSVLINAASPGGHATIRDVLTVAGPRLAAELGNLWTHCDALESKLFAEFDSSRMFRLMGLLNFVNERGDAGVEPQWSETGDRYLLKLFRDYVFHQVDANGRPILDMAHVVECLSRLDVGSPEQVLLSSRDGSSLLVASYEDLRQCLLQAVDALRGARGRSLGHGPSLGHGHGHRGSHGNQGHMHGMR